MLRSIRIYFAERAYAKALAAERAYMHMPAGQGWSVYVGRALMERRHAVGSRLARVIAQG